MKRHGLVVTKKKKKYHLSTNLFLDKPMNDELCSLLHNASFDFFLENGEIQEFSGIMMLPPPFRSLSLSLSLYFFLSF